jgi:hypothetical protein
MSLWNFVAGAFLIGLGLLCIWRRRLELRVEDGIKQIHGAPAILLGVISIAVGVAVMIYGNEMTGRFRMLP